MAHDDETLILNERENKTLEIAKNAKKEEKGISKRRTEIQTDKNSYLRGSNILRPEEKAIIAFFFWRKKNSNKLQIFFLFY